MSEQASRRPFVEASWRHVGSLGLALLVAVHVGLAVDSAGRKSVTVDELGHLPSGLLYLETGDPRYASLNPPLVNALSALPVLLLDLEAGPLEAPPSDDPFSFWANGYRFMEHHASDYLRIFAVARMVPIAVVAGLGILVFAWARQLAPEAPQAAGLLAAGLVLLSPNVLAQSRLVGTDTGTAFFVALALFCFRRMLLRPSAVATLLLGLTLGLAQLSKLYALLLYPVMLALIAIWPRLSAEPRQPIGPLATRFAAAVGVSWLVLNSGYLWSEFGTSLDDLTLQSSSLQSLQQSSLLGRIPLPLPGAYVRAFDGQLVEVSSRIPSFLFGERFQGGRWNYYLAVLAIKTPLPLLLCFGSAMVLSLKRRLEPRELALLLAYPLLLFLILSLGDRRQLGARALLSAVPLVQLWIAATLTRALPRRWPAAVTSTALAWLAIVSLVAHPDHLAYFNVFVGGSEQGYRYASDANVDIGQDLVELASYMEEEDIEQIQLLYFGSVNPALYGIEYRVPEPDSWQPGPLAVSVSLRHLNYPMYDHGVLRLVGPARVTGEPVRSIGGSIQIYEIPE